MKVAMRINENFENMNKMKGKMQVKYATKNANKMNKKRWPWSKFGVWQMPLFKFLRHGDLKDKIFESTSRRDLNIKYTKFDQLKWWMENKLKDITREEKLQKIKLLSTTFEMTID